MLFGAGIFIGWYNSQYFIGQYPLPPIDHYFYWVAEKLHLHPIVVAGVFVAIFNPRKWLAIQNHTELIIQVVVETTTWSSICTLSAHSPSIGHWFWSLGFTAQVMVLMLLAVIFYLHRRRILYLLVSSLEILLDPTKDSVIWSIFDNVIAFISEPRECLKSLFLGEAFTRKIEEGQEMLYKYEKLQLNEIRLLELLKWHPRRRVCCRLIRVPLNQLLRYEAISYCWGNSTDTRTITMNRKHYNVSPKVFNILEECSSVHCSKLLWIDSICINQSDNEEKSNQTQLMWQIYHQASEVIVYLGDGPWAQLALFWLAVLNMSTNFTSSKSIMILN